MKKPLPLALASLLALALGACGGSGPEPSAAAPSTIDASSRLTASGPVAGEVIVQLNSGVDVAAIESAYGLRVIDRFGLRPIWRLRLPTTATLDPTVEALRADSRILFAEPNFESETPEGRRRTVWATGGDAGLWVSQWAPASVRLGDALTVSRGAGIRVAVLDTGIDLSHPALAGRLARRGDGSLLGRDFVDDDGDPSEVGVGTDPGYGHGTHVAGLVALTAPDATLMPVRVLDRAGRGNVWVLAEALAWAVDPDGDPLTDDAAHVINLSLGTTQPTQLLRTVVSLASCDFDDDDDEFDDAGFDDDRARCDRKHAAVVLSAAGNDGSDTERLYPAAETVPGALAVTAHTRDRTLASFANRGPWVQIAAPGDALISTFPGGGYATWSGTSMASPLAAGAAALVLATYADPRSVLPLDITQRLVARSAALCSSPLRRLDTAAAVRDASAPELACP